MAAESRASTSRAATARPSVRTEYKGLLDIDTRIVPKDKVYLWVRESTLGQPDGENVAERMMQGYMPVPAERHPELVPPALPGHEKSTLVRRRGMLLMEIAKVDYDADRDAMRRENEEILRGVDADRQRSADPNIPTLRAELDSRVERNGRFDKD